MNSALFGVICPVVNIHQHPDRKTVKTWFFVPIPPHMGNKVKNRIQRQMMKETEIKDDVKILCPQEVLTAISELSLHPAPISSPGSKG